MKSVCVCSSCGRTIEKEYIYCPWCGLSKINSDDRESLDLVFNQLEQKQAVDREKRVVVLERVLDEMEKELDMLALSVEMAK